MNKNPGEESFEKHYLEGEGAHNQHFLPFVYAFFAFHYLGTCNYTPASKPTCVERDTIVTTTVWRMCVHVCIHPSV